MGEDMRKRSDNMFFWLVVVLIIYYAFYTVLTFLVTDADMIFFLITSYNVLNLIFTFLGLLLYLYTIMMLRQAIQRCASFQFETSVTYVICGIFLFILCLEVFYLLSNVQFQMMVVITALCHFFTYFVVEVAVFVMLLKTGTDLKLVSHRLNNGKLQFEGYSKDNKHLFTFVVGDTARLSSSRRSIPARTESQMDSEFSHDDDVSKDESNIEGDRLTEYDATEKLLFLQP